VPPDTDTDLGVGKDTEFVLDTDTELVLGTDNGKLERQMALGTGMGILERRDKDTVEENRRDTAAMPVQRPTPG
jgi:hypothetical protein